MGVVTFHSRIQGKWASGGPVSTVARIIYQLPGPARSTDSLKYFLRKINSAKYDSYKDFTVPDLGSDRFTALHVLSIFCV